MNASFLILKNTNWPSSRVHCCVWHFIALDHILSFLCVFVHIMKPLCDIWKLLHKMNVILPCQWKYWHRAKNRLRDKTGFGMYSPQNVEKSGFGQSVCLSVRLSVCLSVLPSVLLSLFPRALTGVRFKRSSWNFRGMFGYMGHCAVPIFEAIREPVYKII